MDGGMYVYRMHQHSWPGDVINGVTMRFLFQYHFVRTFPCEVTGT